MCYTSRGWLSELGKWPDLITETLKWPDLESEK